MKRTLFFFAITLIVGLTAVYLFPYYTINPGVLVKGHSELRNNCFSCHSIGKGASTKNCIACHNLSGIGKKTSAGLVIEKPNNKTNLLHKAIKDLQCHNCHTEHNGLSRENAMANFTHTMLPEQMQKNCIGCHSDNKPDNKIHNAVSSDCSSCHNTDSWQRAEFKHELLFEKQNDCGGCHSNKIPDDELHNGLTVTTQCSQCHDTNVWKPSTFEHIKYFRFDENHPSSCTNCHNVNESFKLYTCYNCHEHQPSRIAAEHLEEGIRDFNNCVNCHRSGDEDEVKGKDKKGGDDDD